jgi:drug/metabolite transporter (DMT)-like permease
MPRSIAFALAAAALFGASTPLAKSLGAGLSPFLTAGLLYLGSGLGLALARLVRDRGWKPAGLAAREWPWLLGAILFGGVLGPLGLMAGLRTASAATASLLLNLEAVLTAAIAWLVFRENADRRVVLGMAAIVAGGAVLAWADVGTSAWGWAGSAGVALACLCWAIDNNLTRKVSASDALFIAACKGLVAGSVNTALALGQGVPWPTGSLVLTTMAVGLLGYGVSLVLFVLALRGLGTARTGAYFSTAPFLGALVAIVFWGEPTTGAFWLAAALMGLGVVLHVSERHEHEHAHEPLEHTHPHSHDAHHQHSHGFAWDGAEPHVHPHHHGYVRHSHPHYPDIHHQHRH